MAKPLARRQVPADFDPPRGEQHGEQRLARRGLDPEQLAARESRAWQHRQTCGDQQHAERAVGDGRADETIDVVQVLAEDR